MATLVLKTCNCCLPRNRKPALLGARAKIKYCRQCRLRTVWSAMGPEDEAAYYLESARRAAFLESLLAEVS